MALKMCGPRRERWLVPEGPAPHGGIAYSAGIGTNCDVEVYLSRIGYEVWCFDPTPDVEGNIVLPLEQNPHLHFMPVAVGLEDGEAVFHQSRPGRPLYTLEPGNHRGVDITVPVLPVWTIMHNLGHPRIDLLKMDIEGSEADVIQQVLDAGVRPDVLMIEWHDSPERANQSVRQQLEIVGYKVAGSLKGHFTYIFSPPF